MVASVTTIRDEPRTHSPWRNGRPDSRELASCDSHSADVERRSRRNGADRRAEVGRAAGSEPATFVPAAPAPLMVSDFPLTLKAV